MTYSIFSLLPLHQNNANVSASCKMHCDIAWPICTLWCHSYLPQIIVCTNLHVIPDRLDDLQHFFHTCLKLLHSTVYVCTVCQYELVCVCVCVCVYVYIYVCTVCLCERVGICVCVCVCEYVCDSKRIRKSGDVRDCVGRHISSI